MNSLPRKTDAGQAASPESTLAGNGASRQDALRKYEAILDNASVGIAFTKDRAFQHANRAFEELFAWPADGLIGQPGIVVWGSQEEYAEVGKVVGPLLSQGKPVELERRMMRRDGTIFWCRIQARPIDHVDPAAGGTIWIIEDITERRQAVERLQWLNEELEQRVQERTVELALANVKLEVEIDERLQAEERARHLSLHDALTGLPNRRLLQDRLAQSLAQARREGWQVAVMFIDLDRFKHINDTLGHAVGDEVLRETARRLTASLRDSDTVSRVGGDEFVVVLPHAQVETDLAPIAAKLMTELSEPCRLGGRELRVTPSIGVSVFPLDGDDPEKLLNFADAAMYHAKAGGRRNVQFYAASMSAAVQARVRLEDDLHLAAARNEFELYYQPRIDLASRTATGFEALLRWHHPVDGLLEPAAFMPIAEDSGLIVPIGDWAIGEACRQMKRWREANFLVPAMAVNLSARQFFNRDLASRLRQVLADTGLSPGQLELEIAEGILMANTGETHGRLDELRDLGVRLSIDDFGTGFSSFASLKRFHIDNLKIDDSLVGQIGKDADGDAIVRAIVNLARSLQLRVVAEGVETREQRDFLAECGCQEAQGTYFARPLPAGESSFHIVAGPMDVSLQS